MLLETGYWIGRGSWLHESDSVATNFSLALRVQTTYSGSEIQGEIKTRSGQTIRLTGESTVSSTGLYELSVVGPDLTIAGISKLESLPHVALFWSNDRSSHACVTVFALRQLHGIRGFLRRATDTYTFEVALEKQDRVKQSGNIVQFDPNRGKT